MSGKPDFYSPQMIQSPKAWSKSFLKLSHKFFDRFLIGLMRTIENKGGEEKEEEEDDDDDDNDDDEEEKKRKKQKGSKADILIWINIL